MVQHGPDPPWADLAHDLPILALVAADAAAALAGRGRVWWWWVGPTAGVLSVIVLAPRAGDHVQVAVATAAVVLSLVRARVQPDVRRRTAWALLLLGVGGVVGALSGAGGPLCVPDGVWQGHAVWHVLAAAALVILAPVVQQSTPAVEA